MAGIWFRLRAEWHTRWKAAVSLGIIAGLTGAVTLAAIAGARRTETAFDRFLLLAGIPALLLVANTVAFVPGRIAARLRPATVLRSE